LAHYEVQRRHLPLFNRTELVVIEDSGHTMFGENTEKSLEILRRYLAEPRELAIVPKTGNTMP
jgi:pimeloyl-ACP methyl ester carboxylesterase